MKHTRKRILSLLMSGIMTASLLPAYLAELPIPAASDDPIEDNDPTIDFDYATRNNILNADDALKDIAQQKKKQHVFRRNRRYEAEIPVAARDICDCRRRQRPFASHAA